MNVVTANENKNIIDRLDFDIIKRIDGEYPRVILYNNDKVSLEISFEGNLDLYFVLKGADIDNKIIINESNLRVYVELFVRPNAVIKDLSVNLQNRIKEAIKKTADLDVKEVNIKIRNIASEDKQ